MNVTNGHTFADRSAVAARRRAMTLVELMAAMSIMAVLAGATMSSMLIASHAMPERSAASTNAVKAMDALDQLADELTYATTVTTLSATEIIFTVADRGHGAAGPETIRYAWSGSPGAPVVRQYNGGEVHDVVDAAAAFSITPSPAAKPVSATPRVLLIVATAATSSLTPNESSRISLLQSWGFTVNLMAGGSVATDLITAVPATDVLYIPADVGNLPVPSDLDARIGVVLESCSVTTALALSSGCASTSNGPMTVEDNEQEILSCFSLGASLPLASPGQPLTEIVAPAASADVLGRINGSAIALVAYEIDDKLTTGSPAKARRVRLPWGLTNVAPFPINLLTENGRTILRRSLVWAAATPVIARVRIVLQADDPGATAMETEVLLLNQPRDPRP